MNQAEMVMFFSWCEEHLAQFKVNPCDESTHYYLGDVQVGGWAGDSRQYFYNQCDELASALRMMNAAKAA